MLTTILAIALALVTLYAAWVRIESHFFFKTSVHMSLRLWKALDALGLLSKRLPGDATLQKWRVLDRELVDEFGYDIYEELRAGARVRRARRAVPTRTASSAGDDRHE